MKISDTIISSNNRVTMNFKGNSLYDALCFGFSYIEYEDHIVNYIVSNNKIMKDILKISDSKLNPDFDSLGELWTAKLLLSNKLGNDRILFSNSNFSAIINLNLNKDGEDANI